MDDVTGGFEAEMMENNVPKMEVVEKQTAKIEVRVAQGERIVDEIQRQNIERKLDEDGVGEKLIQFENLLGPSYTKQKASEGQTVNLKYGKEGNGEVVDGVLSVDLPDSDEIKATVNDERSKKFLDVLAKAGTTYENFVATVTTSTVLHESEHMIIDSKPGSQLAIDFENAQPLDQKIELDENGHVLSLLDEGITYAFQIGKDNGNELFQKLEGDKPQVEDSFTIATRKKLGEALRGKVKEYVDGGEHINESFLKFAGDEMKKLDIERYVKEAEYERTERILSGAAEKIVGKENSISLITNKEIVAPTGDKKDYVSMSPYSWQTEDGSWIIKDGEINPLTEKYADENKLNKISGEIILTSLAAEYTRDAKKKERFSQRANETLKSWFVNEETRMNPNLENAQLLNPDSESGSFYGIIEGVPLVRIAESVEILKKNGLIDGETLKGVETWFNQYLTWLTTSEKGIGNPSAENEKERGGERGMKNNHGTFYDVQVAYVADFLGKTDMAKQTLEGAKNRIASQIEPSGEMKEETARGEVSRDYQIFNLYAFAELASLGDKYDVDLWHHKTEDGRSLEKAFTYFDSQLRDAGDKPFKFDRTGTLYFAYREASKAYENKDYWKLPNRYYMNQLADDGSKELLRLRENK
jgi:hypothetical protein